MGTTINLANVALGFDVSKIQRGVDLSAAEIRKLSQIVRDSVSPVDRYNREVNILERAHSAGALSAQRMSEAMKHLDEKYRQIPRSASSVSAELKSTIAQYAGLAAAFRGVQSSLSLAATAESNKISLEVLTGSAQKASILFEGFIALDRSSPLSRSDFSRAAQTLIGYGLSAEQTMPALRALSEVSVGNAERFQSLALAFGQVQANGRLMGQEVLQMVNAGFNPLQEISRTTGISMIDLKKQMEAGAISAQMVEDAFKSATSEGGRFFDMNERLKNSSSGQYAKMKSDVEMLATEIGTNLLPAAKALMEIMNAGANSSGQGGLLPGLAANFSSGIEWMTAAAHDAFTNLDGSSYGTKLDEFYERLGKRQGEQQVEALRHVLNPEEQLIREQNMARFSENERKEAKRLADEEKARKDQEIADAQRKLEQEKLLTQEKEKQRKIDLARLKQAESKLERAQTSLSNEGNNIAAAVAPALRAGSVEAYRFMLNQRNEAAEIAKKQTEIAELQLEVQKQQLEVSKSTQILGIAGVSS